MKVKLVFILIAALILALLGYGTSKLLSHQKNSPSPTPETSSQTQNPAKNIKDLLNLGTAQKCTYKDGIVYTASGMVRGDFNQNSHMIVKDNTSYIWMDGENTGYKNSFDPNKQATPAAVSTSSPEAGQSGQMEVEQPQDYTCSAWTADSNMFELPKNVTFTDTSAMMAPTAVPGSSGTSSQCSYCDSLNGNDKTQCLKALNCQ